MKFFRCKFSQKIQRFFPASQPQVIDNALAHKGSNACVAVGIACDGVPYHRVDPDKARSRRNGHITHDLAGTAKDVGQFSFSSTGDSSLIHDPAGGSHDLIFRQLAESGDSFRTQAEFQIGIEAGEGGDFHGGRTSNADAHRHGTQHKHAESKGKGDSLFFEQGEDAAADVGGP